MMTTEITQDLDPKQREAVRYYTDPLLPTFGNKSQSKAAAGYNRTSKVFDSPAVQQEIARIQEQRYHQGTEVAEYIGTYVIDAARALVENLKLGKTLSVTDPLDLTGPPTPEEVETARKMVEDSVKHKGKAEPRYSTLEDALGAIVQGRLNRASEITKANRVAVQASREAKDAAELILRYHMGDPGNRHGAEESLPLDLSNLSPDELLELGDMVNGMIEEKKAAAPEDDGPVVEGEWSEEPT